MPKKPAPRPAEGSPLAQMSHEERDALLQGVVGSMRPADPEQAERHGRTWRRVERMERINFWLSPFRHR